MSKEQLKPWALSDFELYRPTLSEWVRNVLVPLIEDPNCNLVAVKAPVKAGKREIAEYVAMRDLSADPNRYHVFITALNRKADKGQMTELKKHNMTVYIITTDAKIESCLTFITNKIKEGKKIIIHLDECDYGSGENQKLAKLYKNVRELQGAHFILYSATPAEVECSGDVFDEDSEMIVDEFISHGICVTYTPPPGFCGPDRFLDEGLVHEATPSFRVGLEANIPIPTEQGCEFFDLIKQGAINGTGKNIGILRLTMKNGKTKEDKDIHKFIKHMRNMPELSGFLIFVDDKDGFKTPTGAQEVKWSEKSYWDAMTKIIPILIVHDQTSSRSTEWACHDRVAATHDYRTSASFAVITQAQQRPNHYESKYGGFQRICIYGDVRSFQLSAGRITYDEYLQPHEWSMKKIDVRRAKKTNLGIGDKYEIKNRDGLLHPIHNMPLTISNAENILIGLGCFGDVSVSSRVKKVKRIPMFDTYWFSCVENNFQECITTQLNSLEDGRFNSCVFLNPFQQQNRPLPENGHEKGYLRGWSVFDYDTHIKTDPGWGVTSDKPRLTICYCQEILGVAIRWHTGKFKEVDKLTAYRSMYSNKKTC